MNQFLRRYEWPIIALLFLGGAAFLLKMCYLSLAFNTVFGVVFLTAVYGYVRARYALFLAPALLALVLGRP